MPDTLPELPAFLYSRDLTARELREIEQYGAECRRQALEDAAMAVERSTAARRTLFGMMNNCEARPCEHAAAVRALKEQQ